MKGYTPVINLKRILVTTDLSEFSLAAMEYAVSLGLLYSSKITLLHVVNGASSPSERTALEEKGMQDLRGFMEMNIDSDYGTIPVVCVGDPAVEIARFAEQERMDLIVMATHGRTGLLHMIMGSVAEKVVRGSHVPVLTVKPRPVRDALLRREDVERELHIC
jgi:universal stress protein A